MSKWESENETGDQRLMAYYAQMTGTEHMDLFDELGVTGPYYLTKAPVAPGSVQVWLVTISDDPGVGEIERVLLIEDMDYTVEPGYGVLWLRQAPAGVDEHFNARHLEVVYRTRGSAVVGEISGVRAEVDTGIGPLGLSYAREIRGTQTHRVMGIDGEMDLGTYGLIKYELGNSELYDGTDRATGLGMRLHTSASLAQRMKWSLAGQWVDGKFLPPGRSEMKEGTEITSALSYALRNGAELKYERGYMHDGASEVLHSDRLTLGTRLGAAGNALDLRLQAGIESKGEDVLISADRSSRVHAGLGWTWGERVRLNLVAGLEAGSDQRWKLTVPTEASLRAVHGNVMTSVGYRRTFGQGNAGKWVASMESAPQGGLSAYTRYAADGTSSQWTLGARQGWAVTPDLTVTIGAEGRTESGTPSVSSDRTAVFFNSAYRPADGSSQATLSHDMEHFVGGTRHNTRLAWQGRWAMGWSLRLSGSLLSGPSSVTDSRRVLQDELSLALDYRDVRRSRHTLLGQVILRGYEQQNTMSGGDVQSRVDVAGLDWGYRLTDGLALHAKAAVKRDRTESLATFRASLAQVGAEVMLTQRLGVEVFGRHLRDSTGAKLSGHALELVYTLTDNMGMSVGTSTLGVKDPDLALVAPWPEGLYYRVRLKF